jgi:hypothetical protein
MIPNDKIYRLLLQTRLQAFLGWSFHALNPGKELSSGLCCTNWLMARFLLSLDRLIPRPL